MNSIPEQTETSPKTKQAFTFPAIIERNLADKSYARRKHAALLLQKLLSESPPSNVLPPLNRLIAHFIESTDPSRRKGGLIGIASLTIALPSSLLLPHLDKVVHPTLLLMTDHDSRVRYYACESLYNITKVLGVPLFKYFTLIYAQLSALYADVDIDVCNGASVLDKLLRDLLPEVSPDQFDLDGFVAVLKERIFITIPAIRLMNTSWLVIVDALPHYSLLEHTPFFCAELLDMHTDPRQEVRSRADATLGYFISQCLQNSHNSLIDLLGEKWLIALVEILLCECKRDRVVQRRESGNGTVLESRANPLENCYIPRIAALEWVSELVKLGGLDFFERFPNILDVILTCLACEHVAIEENAKVMNDVLFTIVSESEQQTLTKKVTVGYLIRHLDTSNLHVSVVAGDWIKLFIKHYPSFMEQEINKLLNPILHLLSGGSPFCFELAKDLLSALAGLTETIFQLVIQELLDLLFDTKVLSERGVEIVALLCRHHGYEKTFVTISETLETFAECPSVSENRLDGISFIVQTLNSSLLVFKEFQPLRNLLLNAKSEFLSGNPQGKRFFQIIFKSWTHDFVSCLSLCLLIQFYELGYVLISLFDYVEVTVGMLAELKHLVDLFETPSFETLRMQLVIPERNPFLLKILYGILLILPQDDTFKALSCRIDRGIGNNIFLNCTNNIQQSKQKFIVKHQVSESDIIDIDKLVWNFLENRRKHNVLRVKALQTCRIMKM